MKGVNKLACYSQDKGMEDPRASLALEYVATSVSGVQISQVLQALENLTATLSCEHSRSDGQVWATI